MPVSKISVVGCRDSKDGGSRWIGQRSASSGSGSPSSIVSPSTLKQAAERLLANRDADRGAGVDHVDTARNPVGGVHRDGAHPVVAEVLLHLRDQVDRGPLGRSGSWMRSAV